jgi:hypothetical protein
MAAVTGGSAKNHSTQNSDHALAIAYGPSTEPFYDWVYVAFDAALNALRAMFQLLALSGQPRDMQLLQIRKSYDEIIQTTVTTIKRAPLHLVAPTILILYILEQTQHNDGGADNLWDVFWAIVDANVGRLNLAQSPLDVVCFPQLVLAFGRFESTLHSPTTIHCLEGGGEAKPLYAIVAFWMTRCFPHGRWRVQHRVWRRQPDPLQNSVTVLRLAFPKVKQNSWTCSVPMTMTRKTGRWPIRHFDR